jgi:hypothetical protein
MRNCILGNEFAMSEGATVMIVLLALTLLFIGLLIKVLFVWAFCRICSKAGFSWALGLLMLVPVADIVLPLVLAFSTWPIHKEMQKLKSQQSPAMVG